MTTGNGQASETRDWDDPVIHQALGLATTIGAVALSFLSGHKRIHRKFHAFLMEEARRNGNDQAMLDWLDNTSAHHLHGAAHTIMEAQQDGVIP